MLVLMKRAGVVLILILAFCGVADSAYIARQELAQAPLICNETALSGCNTVATSQYSYFLGRPVAEYGVIFYAVLFILAALEIVAPRLILRRALQGLSFLGLLASMYLTATEIFIIKALCIYCLASAGIALLIFISGALIEPLRMKQKTS